MEGINIKEIVANNNVAEFSHAIAGVLYYSVNTGEHIYMFQVDMNDREDVGTATFEGKIKAITLMRYINKALKNNSLIKIK